MFYYIVEVILRCCAWDTHAAPFNKTCRASWEFTRWQDARH